MKFSRSQIMNAAWNKYRCFNITFSQALSLAWREAKVAAMRFNVIGYRLRDGSETLVAGSVEIETANEITWRNRCAYDVIEVRVAA